MAPLADFQIPVELRENIVGYAFFGNDYEGAFQGDVPRGQGKMVDQNGNVYEGEWNRGRQTVTENYITLTVESTRATSRKMNRKAWGMWCTECLRGGDEQRQKARQGKDDVPGSSV